MFTKDDLNKFKAFEMIVRSGNFEIKGDAIVLTASLLNWFKELELKVEKEVNKKPAKKMVK